MMSRSSNNANALILGGISVLSVACLVFYLYSGKVKTVDHKGFKPNKPKEDVADSKQTEDEISPAAAETEDSGEESAEEEDDSEVQKKSAEVALKEAYDDSLRLAKKLLLGNAFDRAAAKYSEAIEMAHRIPSAKKDLPVLYNNRSAMYEKAGAHDKSLLDINEVLALDVYHIKARTRRGRLYETMGMATEALNEYVAVIFADRKKGSNPSTIEKADEICRLLAANQTAERLEKMRTFAATSSAPLPTKSYCRKFFEALPCIHEWRVKYQGVDRSEVANKFKVIRDSRAASGGAGAEGASLSDLLSCAIDLACIDIATSLFVRAFATVNTCLDLLTPEMESSEDVKQLLSVLYQLKGVENLFRRNDYHALSTLKKAILLDSTNLEANLVLCILHLEMVQIKEAEDVITSCMSLINGPPSGSAEEPLPSSSSSQGQVKTAWVMIQRSQIWVTRNEKGMFGEDAVVGAMRDLDVAMALTESSTDEGSKRVRLAALLKTVYILLQLKTQTGQAPSEEDQNRVRMCVDEAKLLFPKHEEVLMLDAESAASESNFNEALARMEVIIKGADPSDTMPIIIKANILMQMAFFGDQSGSREAVMETQRLLESVEQLYQKAIETEPNALEAMVQCAQLLGMIGQVDKSLEMSTRAVGFTRSREEMQVLIQLILFTQAQILASKEMEG